MKGAADHNLKLAGKHMTPWDSEYLGSATVHFYKSRIIEHTFDFAHQMVGMNMIQEGQADLGLKTLRTAMMAVYGKEDKRRTDTPQVII